jgi:hypothetical protein
LLTPRTWIPLAKDKVEKFAGKREVNKRPVLLVKCKFFLSSETEIVTEGAKCHAMRFQSNQEFYLS